MIPKREGRNRWELAGCTEPDLATEDMNSAPVDTDPPELHRGALEPNCSAAAAHDQAPGPDTDYSRTIDEVLVAGIRLDLVCIVAVLDLLAVLYKN